MSLKTIKQYTNIKDVEKLSLNDLKSQVRKEVYKANRNRSNLILKEQKDGVYIPSLHSNQIDIKEPIKLPRIPSQPKSKSAEAQGNYSLELQKYIRDLKSKLREARYFNQLETSSLRKQKKFEKEMTTAFEKRFGSKIKDKNKFWKIYKDYIEKNKKSIGYSSEQVQKAIAKKWDKIGKYKQTKRINEVIDNESRKIYEQEQDEKEASAFFSSERTSKFL